MSSSDRYDVFLSYHWRDQGQVEAIAHGLRAKGVKVFLDRWYLVPGQPWPQALEHVLSRCGAVAVCLGPGDMGPWQQREKDVALDRQARDPTFPVIPVLLPGADPVLGFLRQNTWVDLRERPDDPICLTILAGAIRGEPPGPDAQEKLQATLATLCPYRGLLYFREEDASFFFGRALAIEPLVQAVAHRNLLAVVGASGSGKSSVVRAGLVPALRRDRNKVWEVTTLVPGDRPLHALATALAPLLEPEKSDETDRLIAVNKQVRAFQAGDLQLRDIVERVLQKQPGTDRLLLIIDQWEELYTLTQDDEVRRRFVDELLAATTWSPLSVVFTLRGDFLGQALANRPLSDHLQNAQVNLGPMTRAELQKAIKAPAEKVGLSFEAGLAERILDDVGDEPGNLPLLEFVLKRLWEDRRGGQLVHEAYQAIGCLKSAVAQKAEEVFGNLSALEQQAVQRVFLHLVRPGKGVEDTRRRASFVEIGETSRQVVRKLADARLLVTAPSHVGGGETIEVSHEALIQNWDRLKAWINEDREFLLWRERLRGLLAEWQRSHEDENIMLRGPLLAEAERWLKVRGDQLSPEERGYIGHSCKLKECEQQTEKARRERELQQAQTLAAAEAQRAEVQRIRAEEQTRASRKLKASLAVIVMAAIGLVVFTWITLDQRNKARDLSKIALSRQLVAQSVLNTSGALYHRLLLSLAARRVAQKFETQDSLLRALQHVPRQLSFLWEHKAGVSSVTFSPDGKTVASGGYDGAVILWDVASRKPLGEPLTGHKDGVFSVAFSPDGRTLASGGHHGTMILWDVASRKPLGEPLTGHPGEVLSVAFSPNGKTLASGSQYRTTVLVDDGPDSARVEGATLILWDVASRTPLREPFTGHSGTVSSVTFSPDGQTLVSEGYGGVILWDVASLKPLGEPLTGHKGRGVFAKGGLNIAFSPDGQILASGDSAGNVILWDVASLKPLGEPLTGQKGTVSSVAFSPDGRALAAGGDHGAVILWDVASRKPLGEPFIGDKREVTSVAFSPDGKRLASGSDDGAVILWDVTISKLLGESLTGHKGAVSSVAFSPDGQILASGDSAGNVILWDVVSRKPFGEPLAGYKWEVSSVAFSPDGRTLAAAGDNGAVMLWDVVSRKPFADEPFAVHRGRRFFGRGGLNIVFSPDGRTLASGGNDNIVLLWDMTSRKPLGEPLTGHKGEVSSVAFNPDGRTLASGDNDGAVILWDVTTRKPLNEPLARHKDRVLSVAFSPDGKTLVSGDRDGAVILWDVSHRQPVGFPLAGIEDMVSSVTFSPDGQLLAAGDGVGNVILWDVASRKSLGEPLTGHQSGVRGSIGFRSDGKFLAHGVLSVAFSPDGKTLASGGRDGTVILWDVGVLAWEKLACYIVNRNLTHQEWKDYVGDTMAYLPICPDLPIPAE